jgi:hypothetical protein
LAILQKVEFKKNLFCIVHEKECPYNPPVDGQKFVIEIAGTTCKDFSSFGKKLLTCGDNCLPMLVWMTSAARLAPHVVVHENVARFDWEILRLAFKKDEFTISSRVFAPLEIGFPMNRPRVYSIISNCALVAVEGRFDMHGFEKCFFAKVVANADIYFKEVLGKRDQEDLVEVARAAGRVLEVGCASSFGDPSRYLSGSSQVRLLQYKLRVLRESESAEGDPPFLCNLQNRASFSDAVTSYMPTLMCRSLLFNIKLNRLMVSEELYSAIGVPMLADVSPISGLRMEPEGLSFCHARLLCGSGMHVPSVAAVLLWVLAMYRPRERIESDV